VFELDGTQITGSIPAIVSSIAWWVGAKQASFAAR
jgi:hypothetical protein